ncbi:outer membrane protein [Methylovirgula ligni]|nr:outer membrane protein [Methylovirgula ligni]
MIASASAADLPSIKEAPAYVPPPPVLSWTGFYVGAEGGYAWGESYQSQDGATTDTYHPRGGFGGGTVGYNWQFSQFVLGLETDFSGGDIVGSLPIGRYNGYGCGSGPCETRINWFGTARGRVGYAFNNVLIYGTGGYAYANIHTAIETAPDFTGTSTRSGWTAGAGVEWLFAPSWSAKLEYLHADFGRFGFGTDEPIPTTAVRFDSVKAGVDYHFSLFAPPTPVVAKY